MRWLRLTAFLSIWAFFFGLIGLVHVWMTVLRLPGRWKIISRLTRNFTLLLRMVLNIKVIVLGDEGQLERGGYVVIANHVGYLDGIVLGSIFPIIFVSKKEVKSWPVIGQWTTLCGTIFIDRQQKGKVSSVVDEMRAKLNQGANILLFPEGTSTNGEQMLPFQTAPLAAPLRNRSIIVPVTIAYKSVDEQPVTAATRDLVCWYGDMDFITHFWKLLGIGSIEVLVTIQPKIECFRYQDTAAGRKKLAEDCYNRVIGRPSAADSAEDDEDVRGAQNPRTSLPG